LAAPTNWQVGVTAAMGAGIGAAILPIGFGVAAYFISTLAVAPNFAARDVTGIVGYGTATGITAGGLVGGALGVLVGNGLVFGDAFVAPTAGAAVGGAAGAALAGFMAAAAFGSGNLFLVVATPLLCALTPITSGLGAACGAAGGALVRSLSVEEPPHAEVPPADPHRAAESPIEAVSATF
jgi:hypothetical protein